MEFGFIRPVLGEQHGLFYLLRAVFLLDGLWPDADNFFSTVSWSISVEFVAYILAATLFSMGRTGAVLGLGVAGCAVLAMVTGYNEVGFGLLLQRGMLGFFMGCATYALYRRFNFKASRMVANVAEMVAVVSAITSVTLFGDQWWAYILCAPVFAIVILVFAEERGAVSDFLKTGPALSIGLWSYSIYMVHLFFISSLNRALGLAVNYLGRPDLARTEGVLYGLRRVDFGPLANTLLTLLVLGLAIAVASFTYRFVEKPSREWGRRIVSARRDRIEGMEPSVSP